jgi:hypothetical protein
MVREVMLLEVVAAMWRAEPDAVAPIDGTASLEAAGVSRAFLYMT